MWCVIAVGYGSGPLTPLFKTRDLDRANELLELLRRRHPQMRVSVLQALVGSSESPLATKSSRGRTGAAIGAANPLLQHEAQMPRR
jgi:hypothetical protein